MRLSARLLRASATALRRIAGSVAVAIAFAVVRTPAACAPAPATMTRLTLDNGLRALLLPDPDSGLVAISVLVRAGLPEEERHPGVGGVVAHALFLANASQSERSVSRRVSEFGGVETAWTPDYTAVTCVTVPRGFEDALWQIAQALGTASLDAPGVEAARRSVEEEVARETSDPFRVAYAAVRASVHADDVYRLPLGGEPGAVQHVTPAVAQWYRAQWFSPSDMVVSVVGGIPVERMRRAVELRLSWLSRTRPERRRQERSPLVGTAFEPPTTTRRVPGSTALAAVGYLAPAMRDPDYPALAVLCALAGNGKSSRLFRALRDTAGVGYRVGVYAPPRLREGELMAYVEFAAGRTDIGGRPLKGEQVAATVAATVASIVDRPPTTAELERARRYTVGAHVLARQRVRDRATALSTAELLGPGAETDIEMPGRIAAVTAEDVARVARRYLARHATVIVEP